uniref:Uncharacterized protein n=1 Tax=Palpitomonas bilix TaxID=652834 RepID=A0A7S3DL30_9EUKA|mmetsp:Transcript_42724/g.110098  ORF Transcript_42724/g.110098 Transcript_42724/m.110098 type:complete len:373 (+) Transcript_42724:138-1256(+)|eukprot:CAMPEP_0113877074 /NCGR_PEP_ID=MMETSP0780_2-20120614/5865_1 /TAXON_ID=652834 /ORGANISM="Palpitomonas bilix" /LENGTH=372 /DNA_ID=CAMNT_0000863273 /DNA_START=118 /DNA_END=1236 /DNA_ORIENTATION=- /assembly_acc=CAM_ASM_000599
MADPNSVPSTTEAVVKEREDPAKGEDKEIKNETGSVSRQQETSTTKDSAAPAVPLPLSKPTPTPTRSDASAVENVKDCQSESKEETSTTKESAAPAVPLPLSKPTPTPTPSEASVVENVKDGQRESKEESSGGGTKRKRTDDVADDEVFDGSRAKSRKVTVEGSSAEAIVPSGQNLNTGSDGKKEMVATKSTTGKQFEAESSMRSEARAEGGEEEMEVVEKDGEEAVDEEGDEDEDEDEEEEEEIGVFSVRSIVHRDPSPPRRPLPREQAPKSSKEGYFMRGLERLMFGFGDDLKPHPESVKIVHDALTDFMRKLISDILIAAQGRERLMSEDILYAVREDKVMHERCLELLYKQSLSDELKAISGDNAPFE